MASTKLSLPYYLTNTPSIKLSNSINEGVIVNKDNNLTGEKIKFDNTYLNINESGNANSLIYKNDSSQFGSLAFPDLEIEENNNGKFVLTNDESINSKWTWTNILNLPSTKYFTKDFSKKNFDDDTSINIVVTSDYLYLNNEKYNYIGIIDLYIKLDPIKVSEYINNNNGLCLYISSNSNEISMESFYNILDITTTTNSYINKVKIINNIISPSSTNNYNIYINCCKINNYTTIFNSDNISISKLDSNDLNNLGLQIYGTMIILEFNKLV